MVTLPRRKDRRHEGGGEIYVKDEGRVRASSSTYQVREREESVTHEKTSVT